MTDTQYFWLSFAALIAALGFIIAGQAINLGLLQWLALPVGIAAMLLPVNFLWSRGTFRRSPFVRGLYLAGAVFILGVLARIQHWAGAGLLILTALGMATAVYTYSYIRKRRKALPDHLKVLFVGLYLGGAAVRLMRWRGQDVLELASFIALWLALISVYRRRHVHGGEVQRPPFDFEAPAEVPKP